MPEATQADVLRATTAILCREASELCRSTLPEDDDRKRLLEYLRMLTSLIVSNRAHVLQLTDVDEQGMIVSAFDTTNQGPPANAADDNDASIDWWDL